MIDDLFRGSPEGISYSLFADGGAMWKAGSNFTEVLLEIQKSLNRDEEWSHRWGVESPGKTKAMIFTRKRKIYPQNLKLQGKEIEYTTSFKFLGRTLDRKLNWNQHNRTIKEKCQKDMRLLKIISADKWGADLTSLRRLYCALIRPKLEYAGFHLSTSSNINLLILDRIQFAAARIILGALRCTPTNCLEAEANLMPLSIRRLDQLTKYAARILSNRNDNFEFWSKVIFVDEKSFRSDVSGALHCWRPNGTRYNEEHLNLTRHSGHVSVNMYGWMWATVSVS